MSQPQSPVLQGSVERVTYADAETLYSVLRIVPERGYGDPELPFSGLPATAVGPLARPAAGLRVRLYGSWISHPVHGRQFEFEEAELLRPEDPAGLARYLASPAFPGIGEVLAGRLVEASARRCSR